MNTMSYFDLEKEGNWIEYLRVRLPYSFRKIEQKKDEYILEEPFMANYEEIPFSADYHNYWQRGSVYYFSAVLLDHHYLSDIWMNYLGKIARMISRQQIDIDSPWDIYEAVQMKHMWHIVQSNVLDRERSAMTNMMTAIELCLKAVKTHAEYSENGKFLFEKGHDLWDIYESLPRELRMEIEGEVGKFLRNYGEHCEYIRNELSSLPSIMSRISMSSDQIISVQRKFINIIERMNNSNYTFLRNSPVPKKLSDDSAVNWFRDALKSANDISYHRYSPDHGQDIYPVTPTLNGPMIGRFFYEHLFPVVRGIIQEQFVDIELLGRR